MGDTKRRWLESAGILGLGIAFMFAWTQCHAQADRASQCESELAAVKEAQKPPLDDDQPEAGTDEAKFAAPTSMRDVEPVVHLWMMRGRLGGKTNA